MTWIENVERWRRLPAETKLRLRWDAIPADVAQSMAFECEPVSLESLRELHSKLPPPTCLLTPDNNLIARPLLAQNHD